MAGTLNGAVKIRGLRRKPAGNTTEYTEHGVMRHSLRGEGLPSGMTPEYLVRSRARECRNRAVSSYD